MSLRNQIDIEPLGEGRWARIERSLFRSLDEDERVSGAAIRPDIVSALRWKVAASLVLTGALAAAFGAVTWRTLVQPDLRSGPTRIETASNGSKVEVGESSVDVGPQSTVRVTGDDVHGVSLLLDTGRVECDVAPRRGRPPFLVEAGRVEVRVIGTHFAVTRAGDTVAVDVQRGQVEVISGADHTLVSAGAHWTTPAEVARAAAAADATPATPSDTHVDAPAAPRASSADSRAVAAAPQRPSPRDQYEAASRLEARQPEAALATYGDLARQGGPWGMNALYAQGRLEADRERRDEARRYLHDYLFRYPAGPNAEDARRLLERLR